MGKTSGGKKKKNTSNMSATQTRVLRSRTIEGNGKSISSDSESIESISKPHNTDDVFVNEPADVADITYVGSEHVDEGVDLDHVSIHTVSEESDNENNNFQQLPRSMGKLDEGRISPSKSPTMYDNVNKVNDGSVGQILTKEVPTKKSDMKDQESESKVNFESEKIAATQNTTTYQELLPQILYLNATVGTSNVGNMDDQAVQSKPSYVSVLHDKEEKKNVNFRYFQPELELGNDVDVELPLSSVLEAAGRYNNTLYGYFSGRRSLGSDLFCL
ncbi:uncharacterized protein [Rutidosis leptorrhynchoides]|uniref:uncharacterized protein n=1 Tax=Rutidosis leptorrhynchoides TaxID=125765 RepID=UPI003A99B8BD